MIKEKEKGKEVVAKDPAGNERYVRHDIFGLMSLLGRYDTKIHPMRDYKDWIALSDLCRQTALEEASEMELSPDQASFLKKYLEELPNKEMTAQNVPSLNEPDTRTLLGILEQLDK